MKVWYKVDKKKMNGKNYINVSIHTIKIEAQNKVNELNKLNDGYIYHLRLELNK